MPRMREQQQHQQQHQQQRELPPPRLSPQSTGVSGFLTRDRAAALSCLSC